MDTTLYNTTVDGTVTWVRQDPHASVQSGRYRDDYEGSWRKITATGTIPSNATAVSIVLYCYDETDGTAATYYLAEPVLTCGTGEATGYLPSYNLAKDFTQVGAVRLWGVTPTVGVWIEVGDINLLTGQRCTVAGAMGTATWANFP
jgi:hypothetical protein